MKIEFDRENLIVCEFVASFEFGNLNLVTFCF